MSTRVPDINSFFIKVRDPGKVFREAIFNPEDETPVVQGIHKIFSIYVKLKFIFCTCIEIEIEALKICKRESIGTAQRIFGEEIVMIRVIRELPIPFSEVSRSRDTI